MKMPTPGDYQEAIQNPLNTINDEELKVCTPELNKLGIPFGRTGNFAVTYKMIGNGKKYALKCFTREASDLCKRYDLIHRFLEEQESEYFIDFHYLDNAILIDGEWLPILKMEWVENGVYHILCGGSVNSYEYLCDFSSRLEFPPSKAVFDSGFRICRNQ